MMNNRGELTSGQIVGIVIAIATLILLVLFLPSIIDIFGGGKETDELCRLSVIARATTPIASAQEIVPLRCTTKKMCLSEDGKEGDCGQFAGEEHSSDEIDELGKTNEKRKEKIEKAIADEMIRCWDLMGQGKLGLFADAGELTGFEITKPTCVVCSRIAVEQKLLQDPDFQREVVAEIDVREYMNQKDFGSTGRNYAETLLGVGVRNIPAFEEDLESGNLTKAQIEEYADEFLRNSGVSIEPKDQLAVLFSQSITDESPFEKGLQISGVTFAVVGGGIAQIPVIGNLFTSNFKGLGVLLAISAGVSAYTGARAGFQVAENRDFSAGYCGQFTSSDERARNGCSVVQIVPWDPNVINALCGGGIEGNL